MGLGYRRRGIPNYERESREGALVLAVEALVQDPPGHPGQVRSRQQFAAVPATQRGKAAVCSDDKHDLPHWKCQPYVRPVKTEEEADEKGETPEGQLTKNELRRQRNYQR